MIDFILNCILWTLALYGFWDILKIIKSTLKNRRIESNGIFVIVAVKKIIVTDLDSVDNTKSILEKFSNDYSEIKLVDWDDCKKQLDSLE